MWDAWAAFDGAAAAADDEASPGVTSGSLETSSFEHVSAPGDATPNDAPTAFAAFQEPAADGAESPGTMEPAVDDDAPAAGDSMSTSGDASRPPPPTAIVCKPCAPAATEADDGFTAFEAAPTDTPARADVAPTLAESETGAGDMGNIAELLEQGLFKREYRDHRLEWMIKSGGLQVVLDGIGRDTIRFTPDMD